MKRDLGLVCDVGGTNCRFALAVPGARELEAVAAYRCEEFPDFAAAASRYIDEHARKRKLRWAVIAVAGPVVANAVAMTNRPWRVDGAEIGALLRLKSVRLVNDFSALAAATPRLDAADLRAIGDVAHAAGGRVATSAVVGPGTGLGVGALVKSERGTLVLPSEGGHAAFAPSDDLEREIARVLSGRFGRLSYERLLSGEGLCNIYDALARIEAAEPDPLAPRQITERATAGTDPRAKSALDVFTRVLGAFAGDVALMFGAESGVFVAGGMTPQTLLVFDDAAFRARFEDKGRFREFMQRVPAWIVTHPHAALVGAASLADEERITLAIGA
ncbi:MAG: glucokinase [Hyphomonadaceae bacterium]|nr:glucokinase [Hyphomonadaceae bacterium]